MKYSISIDIDLPRKKMVELFENPDNLKHWQPGFISMEHLSGEAGKPGAQSRLIYKMGKRNTEMIETIKANDLPDEIHTTYDVKGVHNIQENYFEELGPDKTRWTSNSEFQFSGFGMKLMGWLMPAAFKKQSRKYMEFFKEFAEKGTSVSSNK